MVSREFRESLDQQVLPDPRVYLAHLANKDQRASLDQRDLKDPPDRPE
jgi:hypothetical protein